MTPHLAFHDPAWLLLLLAVPGILWLRRWRRAVVWLVPFAAAWYRPSGVRPSWWPLAAMSGGVGLLAIALARPQQVQERWQERTEGYDLMLVVDISPSMLTEDYRRGGDRISRFEAVKPVIRAFLEGRSRDRIGMVVFSGRAYTLAPLTFDHDWLWRRLERIHIGAIEPGTALGDGVAMALLRLAQPARTADGKRLGAFVVLLTDGANNCGLVSPTEAALLAKDRGIPVYAMSVGRHGWVKVPHTDIEGKTVYRNERSDIDEVTLWRMGVQTRGGFFRAYDVGAMERAFRAIDCTQKIPFEPRRYRLTAELFAWLAGPAIALLAAAAWGTRPRLAPEGGLAR